MSKFTGCTNLFFIYRQIELNLSLTAKNPSIFLCSFQIYSFIAEEDKIRLILDNHSAHTSRETQEYLNTVPGRFEFVFTPTHGSWLNMVEGFFSKLTKQMLNGIRVSSKEELESRIYQYFDEINKVPVPYHWSYKLDDIDLTKEDISQIVYEVVNHKAANGSDKDKRAPQPRKRSGAGQDKQV